MIRSLLKLVRDNKSIESLDIKEAISHITTNKCQLDIRAIKSERLFARINDKAEEIGMQVNGSKTQMLCIHPCIHNSVKTHIKFDNERINSTEQLKILGFTFDSKPNATKHVVLLIERFYSKLWSLRYLKRSGLDTDRMLEIYFSTIRSAVEYCGTVYHPLIPNYLSNKLESIQRQALRIIYGYNLNYERLLEDGRVETLSSRREKDALQFALKNCNNPRFSRWFPVNNNARDARSSTRRFYLERQCRTDRTRNNPIQFMIRMLNRHLQALEPNTEPRT